MKSEICFGYKYQGAMQTNPFIFHLNKCSTYIQYIQPIYLLYLQL